MTGTGGKIRRQEQETGERDNSRIHEQESGIISKNMEQEEATRTREENVRLDAGQNNW